LIRLFLKLHVLHIKDAQHTGLDVSCSLKGSRGNRIRTNLAMATLFLQGLYFSFLPTRSGGRGRLEKSNHQQQPNKAG